MADCEVGDVETFKNYQWELTYSTSQIRGGKPVDILHDFYIPALQRAVQYDRMAGYFRSTSLAAASEGYTAFLQHGGKMRLIVGADMAVEDVQAILAGSHERMTVWLLAQLEHVEQWPEEVVNGVSLLARMVAEERLEVRVAFRKNSKTGEAISVDSTEDGYVHEKWFIMKDAEGNRLRGSGSLNESRTALVLNAENIDVNCDWEGNRERQRVDMSADEFELLWHNRNPHMVVIPLPQAVKKRLVKLRTLRSKPTEIDGTVLSVSQDRFQDAIPEPTVEELLRFAVLHNAPKMPGGIYIGMYSAPVKPWPHQEMVSRRLIESWPYSYLLCDEVGLGKTIEAALAIRSLVLSGRVKNVLIAAPASLTEQWQRELSEKAMLRFARSLSKPTGGIMHQYLQPEEEILDDTLYSPQLNIVSTGLLSRKERQEMLERANGWDITLIDEAHYARRSNPQKGYTEEPKYGHLYTCIDSLLHKKTKSLWMATATPMQIDTIEVYDLLKLTGRVGPFQYDPYLTETYFELLGKLIQKKFDTSNLTNEEWRILGRSFDELKSSDPYLMNILEKTVIDSRNKRPLESLAYNGLRLSSDRNFLVKPFFSASPLSRVMMRHTRKLLEEYKKHGQLTSNLARRRILPLASIEFSLKEQEFYDALEKYCAGLSQQIRKNNSKSGQMMIFLLNFLQLRFASSLYAIQKTLERRLKRVRDSLQVEGKTFISQDELDDYLADIETDEDTSENDFADITIDMLLKDRSKADLEWEKGCLCNMLTQLQSISETPSKIERLLQILEGRRIVGSHNRMLQTVIFTRFFDSLSSIKQYLDTRAPGLHVGVFSGMETCYFDEDKNAYVRVTREAIKHLFLKGYIDVLLCTDAAAEGLNLQTADLLINFDLGWNPMKIEQRIGRIDRIGQTHDVVKVLNMCYLGSTEEIVYGRLTERLHEANSVVGTQQISMLPIEPNEFRQLQNHSLTLEELTKRAKKRLKEKQEATAKMELSATQQYEIYEKEHQFMMQKHFPATLSDLWDALIKSCYLKSLGAHVEDEEKYEFYIPATDQWCEVRGTMQRDHMSSELPFLTWGNSTIDKLLCFMTKKLQNYIRYVQKIVIPIDTWSIVGYVVSTTNGARLITSYGELADITVADEPLSEEDIKKATEELQKIAEDETRLYQRYERIQQTNKELAVLQRELVRNVAIGILQKKRKEHVENFQDAIKELEENYRKPYIIDLPDTFNYKEGQSLFQINTQNKKSNIVATPVLTSSAIWLCHRISAALQKHIKKKDQTCENIISRLERLGKE
ncbi:helicase [Megasphaera stantonii]|uniref:Helicase n=1 Tax=Megasphaera stantonii TaxID=2144175 RepID=A0A346B1F6_9FIRM|nr:helicase [Megasphaera stantonii]